MTDEANRRTIQSGQIVTCPECREEYFSPFDKMYVLTFNTCYACDDSSADILEERSNCVFRILATD